MILKLYDHFAENTGSFNWKYTIRIVYLSKIVYFTFHDRIFYHRLRWKSRKFQNWASVSLMSSNECAAYQSLPTTLLSSDEEAINKCKEGYFWCQYSNGSRHGSYNMSHIQELRALTGCRIPWKSGLERWNSNFGRLNSKKFQYFHFHA